jgi:trimeric autotransporter adhesin
MIVLLSSGAWLLAAPAWAQDATAPANTTTTAATPAVPAPIQGGTIHGTVVAGKLGKEGNVPLPGVTVTATNTITGKKYTTATDVDGQFAMKIPRNGRYVVRVELMGFAATTQEVVLTGVEVQAAEQGITIAEKPTSFGMELASRAAADEARQTATTSATLTRGTQNLSLSAGSEDTTDVTASTGNTGTSMPTLSGLGDSAGASNDSVAVSGQSGQMNGLASFSEDDIRQRVADRVADARSNGQLGAGNDPTDAIVSMLGGMMGGGGPGGGGPGGGGGGGGRGGRGGGGGGGGGRGGGSGAFRNFNPAQPHGNIFYQGGNSALNSAPWQPTLLPQTNPSAYSNRFGASIAGTPYIPGLTKPNTKQFVFINFTGQKNLNAYAPLPVRVPTLLERTGDFSQSEQVLNGNAAPVTIYNPSTGLAYSGDKLPSISPQAQALLNYYPAPNIVTSDPTAYNYQTISNAGTNNVAINTRYVRTLGGATNTPFGSFGGGRGGGGGGGRRNGNANAPPVLRQNINLGYNYSHSASDLRNIFLPLGGATESDGNGLNVGYTVSYGRLSNNASVNWNRLNSETRNYFTNKPNNPSATAGLTIPNQSGGFADPEFYNGLPSLSISNFQGLSNTTPNQTINQTISYSDYVAWRYKKHNMRYGFDVRRVHLDLIGGNNPLGGFTFTGYATESPSDKSSTTTTGSGDAFADFLLGLPSSTAIQAGLFKSYLRENVYDWYVTDDWRLASNITISYGLRYEYFGPYSEKDNHLVNLSHDATFSTASIQEVTPGTNGYNSSLVNPDHTMYAPRFGIAWRPKFKSAKDTVVRGGYGINYNTGQYAVFARSLSHQPPFAATQTNTLSSGCTTANMTLANGFGCSTGETIQNNYAVDKNYRLGMVQLYNLNVQRTIPLDIVLNVGYNGAFGRDLDVVGSPNGTPAGVTTPGIEAFDYETDGAASRSNQLVVSAQKRQQKGIALGATYTYSHTIDNASGVGGAVGSPIQNLFNLAAEEGNSSFDQRHNLTGNWVIELPFGPNRAFFNKGGTMSHLLDGFSFSGTFTIASGTYYTPSYSGSEAEASGGNTYQQRPDRAFGVPLKGAGTIKQFFNPAAFVAPVSQVNGVSVTHYGTASPGSIEGPGTVSTNASLSRTVSLGETRSFEARVTATNVFNTVQYSGINTTENNANFGQVTSAAAMRALQVQARYRF